MLLTTLPAADGNAADVAVGFFRDDNIQRSRPSLLQQTRVAYMLLRQCQQLAMTRQTYFAVSFATAPSGLLLQADTCPTTVSLPAAATDHADRAADAIPNMRAVLCRKRASSLHRR